VVGNIGTEQLMNYTVIGDTVNIARRLQEMAGRGEILITEATHHRVERRARVQPYGTSVLYGRKEETSIHLLLDML
jgi:class 3 adenylate cyclase